MAVAKQLASVAAEEERARRPGMGSARWQQLDQWSGFRPLIYLAFAFLYTLPAIYLAKRKLLWDDEFFTLYLSSIRWHELLRGLATGADQHPPSFYYVTHIAFQVLGTSHLVLRLPSILGFGLLCLCLYEIVRRLTTPLWALVALFFPLGTNLYYYATEARGYALVTGFIALALLAWLHATSRPRKPLWLCWLAIGSAAAVACHYYAVMAVACLGLGELVRTRVRREVDWPVWMAMACSLLPIAAFGRTIQSARGYSTHFWAVPIWSDIIRFYQGETAITVVAVCASVALFLILKASRFSRESVNPSRQRLWEPWEATTVTALALLPFIVMVVAKFVTHGFSDRYAISAVVGIATLLTYVLYRLVPQFWAAILAATACAVMYVYQVHAQADAIQEIRSRSDAEISRLAVLDAQNIAIMDITPFHRVSFYAPRSIASRVAYLSDPRASIQYLGHDTIDRGLRDLRPWFPVQVVPLGDFLRENSHFYVFGAVNSWNWLTFELPKWGDTRLLSRGKQGVLLFSVKGVPSDLFPVQEDPGAAQALFTKLPTTGPSLCALWMGPKDCP